MPLPGRFLDEGGSADLAEIVEEELLDHLHLLVVEKREELLPFARGLLEERTVLVERAIGPVEENAEVGTRLHELRGEALLHFHEGQPDGEQRALGGAHRHFVLILLLRADLEAALELVEARARD